MYSGVVVEDTGGEASIDDMTEELDELRRSFTARLRSESLQRKSDNVEKDSRINRLENILESQLDREKAKDQKIAELERRMAAMTQLKEMAPRQRQTVEKQTNLLPRRDAVADTGSERERLNSEKEKQSRTRDNAAQIATRQPPIAEAEDDTDSTQIMDEIQPLGSVEEVDKETTSHRQSAAAPANRLSSIQKLSSLLKRKSSQNKT